MTGIGKIYLETPHGRDIRQVLEELINNTTMPGAHVVLGKREEFFLNVIAENQNVFFEYVKSVGRKYPSCKVTSSYAPYTGPW